MVNAQSRLLGRLLQDLPVGRLEWIGVRPQRRQPMHVVDEAQALAGRGLAGDRRMQGSPGSSRQVSIISVEFIRSIAEHLGFEAIDPALLRRNLMISGINLNALRHQRFQIGEAVFEATAQCHPCSRMETALGRGGLVAMLGYGGLCARIVSSGAIAVGDAVRHLPLQGELALSSLDAEEDVPPSSGT